MRLAAMCISIRRLLSSNCLRKASSACCFVTSMNMRMSLRVISITFYLSSSIDCWIICLEAATADALSWYERTAPMRSTIS